MNEVLTLTIEDSEKNVRQPLYVWSRQWASTQGQDDVTMLGRLLFGFFDEKSMSLKQFRSLLAELLCIWWIKSTNGLQLYNEDVCMNWSIQARHQKDCTWSRASQYFQMDLSNLSDVRIERKWLFSN
jgi:hypothetical protein